MMRSLLAYLACITAITALCILAPAPHAQHDTYTFVQQPTDRPVLQTRKAVWDARMHGSGYPKKYVDYAAWYVRLD